MRKMMDKLSLANKYKEHLEKMRTTDEELQYKLEKIKEALSSKDTEIKKDKKNQNGETGRWWSSCASGLWTGVKIAGLLTLGVAISVGVIAWMSPKCNCTDPDFEICMMALELLDRFEEI
ncbi:differentially expressed in FDCP 6 homolog isoform X1 [Scomber scombrus]|uniref:Differentially expressed in FDCP 6 homolog isoform X1 n=1 Tax=Scomber scombrus TaxID=13677 RepID=A0AAV1PG93_SCOSC